MDLITIFFIYSISLITAGLLIVSLALKETKSSNESLEGYFGPHLILDIRNCNKDKLKDQEGIKNLFIETCNEIEMKVILGPESMKYSGAVPEDWGVTCFLVLAESHMSMHSFVEREFVTLDLYSCKYFNHEKVIKKCVEFFEPRNFKTDVDYKVLKRGRGFIR